MPASGSAQRFSMAAAATRAACQVSGLARSSRHRGGEQLEHLAERVELELVADPVPGPDRAAGIAAQPQAALAGNRLAGHGVGRHQVRAVGQHAVGDERAPSPSSSGCGPCAATARPA